MSSDDTTKQNGNKGSTVKDRRALSRRAQDKKAMSIAIEARDLIQKHVKECADNYLALKESVDRNNTYIDAKRKAEEDRAAFWAKLQETGVRILSKGFEDVFGKLMWLTIVALIGAKLGGAI